MLRWFIGLIVGLSLWMVAGTALADPLTCPQSITDTIQASPPQTENGRLNGNIQPSQCGQTPPVASRFSVGVPFGYNAYIFKNRTAATCMTATLTYVSGAGEGVQAVAYLGSFDKDNPLTNYIGSTGNPAVPGDATKTFRFDVPSVQDFVVVVNQFADSGRVDYKLDVSGCGTMLFTGITPNHGPSAGGTPFAIHGAGFMPDAKVTFGGVPVAITRVDESTLTGTTPPHAAGAVPVVVTNPATSETVQGTFTYLDPVTPTVTITWTPDVAGSAPIYGQGTTIHATIAPRVNGDPVSGTVDFVATGQQNITVSNVAVDPTTGVATIVRNDDAGDYNWVATFHPAPDNPFFNMASSPSTLITIYKSPSGVKLDSSVQPSAPGEEVTFTATVTNGGFYANPTNGGKVTFTNGTTTVDVDMVNGLAQYKTSFAAIGQYPITAHFQGNNNFKPSDGQDGSFVQRVENNTTNITLIGIPTPGTYGTPSSFKATVATNPGSPGPTGTVKFTITPGTSTATPSLDNAGSATFTPTPANLVPENYTVTAVYSGDTVYKGKTVVLTYTVNHAPTTVTLTSNSPVGAQSITLQAHVASTVAGTITGKVQLKEGDKLLGSDAAIDKNGNVTLTITGLTAGAHTIVAYYEGDTNYAPSTSAGFNLGGGTGDAGVVDAGNGGGFDAGHPTNGFTTDTNGGGCDCSTTDSPASGIMAFLAAIGMAGMMVRRRRRS